MKLLFILLVTVTVAACAPSSKIGSVYIENNTDQMIVAKPRFLHDHTLGSAIPVLPNNGTEIATYDIEFGTENDILVQLEEMELRKEGCEIILDTARIEKLTKMEKPGLYIHITKELFKRCKKPAKTTVITETLEG